MCPVQNFTYVSGRSFSNRFVTDGRQVRFRFAQYLPLKRPIDRGDRPACGRPAWISHNALN